MTLFGRSDLFTGVTAFGWGQCPAWYHLSETLTPAQEQEALAIVCEQYPPQAYGTKLAPGRIEVQSGE